MNTRDKTDPMMFMTFKNKSIEFTSKQSNLTGIDFRSDGHIVFKTRSGQMMSFDKNGKPKFKSDTGEEVIEFSGVATDKIKDKSWAIATFSVNGHSSRHHHTSRTEIYYITSGAAKLVIDDKEYFLKKGDSIEIQPMQKHQIFNTSEKKSLELIVECTPAWTFEDHLVDDMQQSNNTVQSTNQLSEEKSRFGLTSS